MNQIKYILFQTFTDLIDLAKTGNHGNIDLVVADTAGSDYTDTISSEFMVSSFGKAAHCNSCKEGWYDFLHPLNSIMWLKILTC